MMERWNTGILGLCVALHDNGLLPVNPYSIIPKSHYSHRGDELIAVRSDMRLLCF
jgi:hypothetical protein